MPQMISLRAFVLRSTRGLSIEFKAKEPTHVPPDMVSEAMERGCVPVDGGDNAPEAEPDDAEQDAQILAALEQLEAKSKPKLDEIEAITGFRPSAAQLNAQWAVFTADS